jgi:hypothetical protein
LSDICGGGVDMGTIPLLLLEVSDGPSTSNDGSW